MIVTAPLIDAFGMTDPGRTKKRNEDQFLIAGLNKSLLIDQTSLSQPDHERLLSTSQGKLLVVADGMGGHGGGDLASTVAIDATLDYVLNIMPWFFRLDESHEDDLRDELKTALKRCHASVRAAAKGDSKNSRMGTTLTMAYVVWPRLFVVHVGDSRCYLYRDEQLEQLTKDHTLAEQMVDEDVISREDARSSRWSHILWNALGGKAEQPQPEVYKSELEPGDLLLLCTDGLTTQLNDGELARELRQAGSSEAVARRLVDKANGKGGFDNITAVVARMS